MCNILWVPESCCKRSKRPRDPKSLGPKFENHNVSLKLETGKQASLSPRKWPVVMKASCDEVVTAWSHPSHMTFIRSSMVCLHLFPPKKERCHGTYLLRAGMRIMLYWAVKSSLHEITTTFPVQPLWRPKKEREMEGANGEDSFDLRWPWLP